MKTLVLYVFHQMNERVQMFFHKALFEADDVDFLVICNNTDIHLDLPSYVRILYRKNVGFDFGGWGEGLASCDVSAYTHFIFVNSSVMGPFVPPYCRGRWTDIFLSGLSPDIRLVGPCINAMRRPMSMAHVQSFAFAMEQETLDLLLSKNVFRNYSTMTECIEHGEIRMSRYILERG